MVYAYNGILFIHENEWSIDIDYKMDVFEKLKLHQWSKSQRP